MLLNILLLIIGFVFLIKGADLLIDGSVSFAKKYGISDIVIGLTIVAFGTSADDFFINIVANFTGSGDLGAGNIVGASITNILLIAGIAAFIYPLKIKTGTSYRELPLAFGAIVVLFFLANNSLFLSKQLNLNRIDGIILLIFFFIFVYYIFGISRIKGKENISYKKYSTFYSIIFITAGIAAMAIGSIWVVKGATTLASITPLSEAAIGLTLLAFGASLPEMTASIIAATKKSPDIAIGNILGSVIFNLTFILGISALIKPINMTGEINTGFFALAMSILILFYFIIKGKKKKLIERWEGVALICLYLIYLVFVVVG